MLANSSDKTPNIKILVLTKCPCLFLIKTQILSLFLKVLSLSMSDNRERIDKPDSTKFVAVRSKKGEDNFSIGPNLDKTVTILKMFEM